MFIFGAIPGSDRAGFGRATAQRVQNSTGRVEQYNNLAAPSERMGTVEARHTAVRLARKPDIEVGRGTDNTSMQAREIDEMWQAYNQNNTAVPESDKMEVTGSLELNGVSVSASFVFSKAEFRTLLGVPPFPMCNARLPSLTPSVPIR